MSSPPSRFCTAAVAMTVRGHSALTAIPFGRNSPARPSTTELGAKLCPIGGVRREPLLLHIERRRDHEDVRIGRLLQISNRPFRYHERTARIDLMHEIKAAHGDLRRGLKLEGACIIDHDIDAAELRRCFGERTLHHCFLAHVDHEWQRLAAGALDLLGHGVDRAFELRNRFRRFGRDRDVRAITRGPQRDRESDAAMRR